MRQDKTIPPFLLRFWPVIVLALLPLIPLYRAVFLGEAIGPFDQLRQMFPWSGPKPTQAWDVLQADGVLQFYVWRDLVFSAWGSGHIPFWNPYQLAGTPLMANSQSGALYPPHVVLGLLHVSTSTAMTLLAWFHLAWAGIGTFVLCRALGGNKLGGFVAGASFSLSTFMIAWTGLPSVIETVAWIPWILGFLVLLFAWHPLTAHISRQVETTVAAAEPHEPIQNKVRVRIRSLLLQIGLGMSIGMMVLAGHLQFVAYGFIAYGLMLLWLIGTNKNAFDAAEIHVIEKSSSGGEDELNSGRQDDVKKRINPVWDSSFRAIIAAVLGLCIAAPQLLAVLNYSQFSHRKNSPTDVGYASYVGSAIQSYELIKMVIPTIQGNPRQVASDQLPVSTYYPAVLKPGANFAESALGVGGFCLLLVCLLPLITRRFEAVWGVMLIGAFAFLLAVGTPLNKLFYYGVPGWSSTGSPGRAICLFVLAMSVGAGIAASRLDKVGELLKGGFPRIAPSLGVFALLVIGFWVAKDGYSLRPGLNAEVIDALKAQAESAAISGGAGLLLIAILAIAFAASERSLRTKLGVAAIPVLSCLAFFGTTLIQTGKPDLAIKNDVGFERIAPINSAWDIFTAVHATVPPNLSALNRIHSLDGYDSLLHRDTVSLLRDIDGKDAAPDANGNMMFIKPSADWKKLAEAGVTQVWSQNPIKELDDMTQEDGLYKYKLFGPGRASTPSGPAKITYESSSQIMLQASGPGKLTVRDRQMPGWLAKVDGVHVPLGGTTWMELELPPGDHLVVLNYVPPGFMTGVLLAIVAWLSVLGSGVWTLVWIRHQNRLGNVRKEA